MGLSKRPYLFLILGLVLFSVILFFAKGSEEALLIVFLVPLIVLGVYGWQHRKNQTRIKLILLSIFGPLLPAIFMFIGFYLPYGTPPFIQYALMIPGFFGIPVITLAIGWYLYVKNERMLLLPLAFYLFAWSFLNLILYSYTLH